MSCCRRLCQYIRFWWRTPKQWWRLFIVERDSVFMVSFFMVLLGLISFYIPHRSAFSETLRKIFLIACCFLFVCLFFEWLYRKWRIIFPSMTLLHANEFQDPGFAWGREIQENPPDPFLGHPIQIRENPLDARLQGGPQRPIVVAGLQEWLMRQQPPAFIPSPVRHRDIVRRTRGTGRVITRSQRRLISRPSFPHTQARPPARQSSWTPFNLRQPFTGLREMSTEVVNVMKTLSNAAFGDDSHQSTSTGQDTQRHFLPSETGGNEGDPDLVNYGASTSRSTKYGWAEVSQQKLQTDSTDESSILRSESDDSNRSYVGKDNWSTKITDTSSEKGGSNESNKSGSNSPSESSPEKDQSSASNKSSPEKSESSESIASSHMHPETPESTSLQMGSLCRRPITMRKLDVIKKSGSELTDPNEPIKTHKSLSSKSPSKIKDSALKELSSEKTSKQKVAKQPPLSETSLTDTSIPKRKVSYSEEQQSESESFSTPKKKVPKVSSEKSPKPSTSQVPEVYSSARRALTPLKRKMGTSSEDEDGSASQSPKKSSCIPHPPKFPKIKEETDSESNE